MSRVPTRLALLVVAAAMVLTGAVAVNAQDTTPRIAVLARSDNPVDALAASAIAAQFGGAVYLTPRDRLSDDARDGLVEFAPDLVIIAGGPVALAPDVAAAVEAIPLPTRRVAGENREATARVLNQLLDEFDAVFPLTVEVDAAVAALTGDVADLDGDVDALDERVAELEAATPPVAGPRLQALVVPGSPIEILRGVGVAGVTSPAPGVFCVAPAADAGIDVATDVVQVAVEWGNSIGDDLAAYWDADGSGDVCESTEIAVQTFSFEDEVLEPDPSDAAFTVTVP